MNIKTCYIIIDTEKLTKDSKFWCGMGACFTDNFKNTVLHMSKPDCHAPESIITLEELIEFLLRRENAQVHSVYEGGKY